MQFSPLIILYPKYVYEYEIMFMSMECVYEYGITSNSTYILIDSLSINDNSNKVLESLSNLYLLWPKSFGVI